MTDRTKAMDNLIAQDADLIDFPLVAAVRELLTDDSMEHLDTFTHNLVQALHKHGLDVIMSTQLQAFAARVKVLEAENERLRGALIEIRDCTGEHGGAAKALQLISAALGDSHD